MSIYADNFYANILLYETRADESSYQRQTKHCERLALEESLFALTIQLEQQQYFYSGMTGTTNRASSTYLRAYTLDIYRRAHPHHKIVQTMRKIGHLKDDMRIRIRCVFACSNTQNNVRPALHCESHMRIPNQLQFER